MQTNNNPRVALSKILVLAEYLQTRCGVPKSVANEISELKQIAEAALAEPARNCDVGTTEEQSARMRKFCSKNGLCRDGSYRCENCGFLYDPNCELRWAQMPYEPEEGGAK